jgi:hypothetical protein
MFLQSWLKGYYKTRDRRPQFSILSEVEGFRLHGRAFCLYWTRSSDAEGHAMGGTLVMAEQCDPAGKMPLQDLRGKLAVVLWLRQDGAKRRIVSSELDRQS